MSETQGILAALKADIAHLYEISDTAAQLFLEDGPLPAEKLIELVLSISKHVNEVDQTLRNLTHAFLLSQGQDGLPDHLRKVIGLLE